MCWLLQVDRDLAAFHSELHDIVSSDQQRADNDRDNSSRQHASVDKRRQTSEDVRRKDEYTSTAEWWVICNQLIAGVAVPTNKTVIAPFPVTIYAYHHSKIC